MKNGAKKSADNSALLLKASAKRLFETLMEQTADRIYIKDRRSRFVVASHSLAKMHGFEDRHELEGLTDFDLFSIEHAQQAFEDEQEIIRSNRPMINKTEKETWPDGAVTWVASSKAPVHLNDGKVAGIIGISRDVTAEKHAQERLARSEARLREQNEIMRSDYESAKKVQGFMIPGRLPVVPGVELGYVWKPMTAVGGDIINFPRNPANALLFFMGDVCGHGVTAAFYTVLVKYLTSHSAEVYADDPRQFLNAVNEQIIGRLNEGFITGLAGHFSPRRSDGSRELFLSHAGHRKVLLYRAATREIELADFPDGMVMGLPGGMAAPVEKLVLRPGDRFYAFTDGILEAADPAGDEFGMARLCACFERHSTLPVQETLQSVYETIAEYTESPQQQDDITLLGFHIAP